MTWQQNAACGVENLHLFYPPGYGREHTAEIQKAKKVCFSCSVRRECLNSALDWRDKHGILGGTTPEERGKILRRQRRRVPVCDVDPNTRKPCTRCGVSKLLTEFYGDSRRADGRQSECKVCHTDKVAGRAQEAVRA